MVDIKYVAIIAILALLLLTFVTIQKPLIQVAFGKPFELKEGETADIEGDIQIKFIGIVADSRCPEDAMCVWAGEAIAEIEVNSKAKSYGMYRLSTLYPLKNKVNIDNYVIEMVDVEPQKMENKSIENYTISLIVTKVPE